MLIYQRVIMVNNVGLLLLIILLLILKNDWLLGGDWNWAGLMVI
jgi:hypothetical protein